MSARRGGLAREREPELARAAALRAARGALRDDGVVDAGADEGLLHELVDVER